MLRNIFLILLILLTFTLTLLFNGSINPTGTTLPAFGKILHPYHGLWANGENIKKDRKEALELNELSSEVTITYNERGVPHIYADNLKDALFAQGYVEGRDRAFQLDFTARAAAGRLSEILGPLTLNFDREKRRNGMLKTAEELAEAYQNYAGNKYAQAYADGINAYIRTLTTATQPFEAKFMGYEIEEWSVTKTMLVRMYMCNYLGRFGDDIANSNMKALLGATTFEELFPIYNPTVHPIVPETNINAAYAMEEVLVTNEIITDTFSNAFYTRMEEGIGSNNWAIDSTKSASGDPIYCSDPHLTLNLPSIWYESQIHTPEVAVHGVNIVGIPGIMIGFNDQMAWGETNAGHDQKDFYRIDWIDRKKGKYLLDDQAQTISQRIEIIQIKGEKDVIDTIRYTYWGPITHWSNDGSNDLAMRWMGNHLSGKDELMTFIDMMAADGFTDYMKATDQFSNPPQNFAMAAANDTIAIKVNGDFPLRSYGDGLFVEKGNKSSNGWKMMIPRTDVPLQVNPQRGFITSSNQKSTGDDYPYFYFGQFSDYRNKALDSLLKSDDQLTVDDMKAMQYNSLGFLPMEVLPTMLNYLDISTLQKEDIRWIDTLSTWNYEFKSNLTAPTIFKNWFEKIKTQTWDEIAGYRNKMQVRYPDQWKLVSMLKEESNHPFFDKSDTPIKETAADIVQSTFLETVRYLREKDDSSLKWTNYQPLKIQHMMRIPGLGENHVVTDGCRECLNANKHTFGPSWRMIVELGETPKAMGVYPGGQSGNPLSEWYKNGIEPWSKGEYYTLALYDQPTDIAQTSFTTILKPAQ